MSRPVVIDLYYPPWCKLLKYRIIVLMSFISVLMNAVAQILLMILGAFIINNCVRVCISLSVCVWFFVVSITKNKIKYACPLYFKKAINGMVSASYSLDCE